MRPSRPVFGSVDVVAADGLAVEDEPEGDPVLVERAGGVGASAVPVVLESCGTVAGFGTVEELVPDEVDVEPASGS